MQKNLWAVATLWFYCLQAAWAEPEPTEFTFRAPESGLDLRYNYDFLVLQLALEKTAAKYGPYRLAPSPRMNFLRVQKALSSNTYPNFFVKLSYEDRLVRELGLVYAKYPVDRGIVGYRVCFANPQSRDRLVEGRGKGNVLDYVIGQGSGWADGEILRSNGFKVVDVPQYESLFTMVAGKRFDLFCRGANELLDEMEAHRFVADLVVDETMVIAYPLPRFFFGNAASKLGAERIEEGLVAAHQDGSLIRLWRENYERSIDFVKLRQRDIHWFKNPFLNDLKFNYGKYFMDPMTEGK